MSKRSKRSKNREQEKRLGEWESRPTEVDLSAFQKQLGTLPPEKHEEMMRAWWSTQPPDVQGFTFLLLTTSGIIQRDLNLAAEFVNRAAKAAGVLPIAVAVDLLRLREMTPEERAVAMPDVRMRAPLEGFFNFGGGVRLTALFGLVRQMTAVLGDKPEPGDDEHVQLAGLTSKLATALDDPATCLAAMALTLLEGP
jgi:hypothetical protein